MNKRIQELADEAGLKIEYQMINPPKPLQILGGAEQFEKFAELIVKECARVARSTPAPNFHEHLKQQLGHTWDMAATEAGREIVKYFGVQK